MNHHSEHEMHGDGHDMAGSSGFMSMVMMTQNITPSPDGLRMEDADITLDKEHPTVAAGVQVVLTIDGDTVLRARVNFDTTKPSGRFTAAGTVDQDLAWLSQFAWILGFRGMEKSITAMQKLHRAGKTDQLAAAALRLQRRISANPFVRWRLKGLAGYEEHDAYDRLLAGLERIAYPESYKEPGAERRAFKLDEVAKSLTGLELGHALTALASFDIAPQKGER